MVGPNQLAGYIWAEDEHLQMRKKDIHRKLDITCADKQWKRAVSF